MARIFFFPIRHHSPACAWHLARLIRERRPTAVLIEGPSDATPLIPLLAHPDTQAPVAIYTTYSQGSPARERAPEGPATRHAAYYPLADFSPELVAVREGLAAGAAVRLIDLSFPRMLMAEKPGRRPRVSSLLEETWLKRSKVMAEACRRLGARDPDDLWDHLFETDFPSLAVEEFAERVETWCALARADHLPEELAAEGYLAREEAMAAEIAREASERQGLVVVVTGGFHTPALRELLGRPLRKRKTREPAGQSQVLLMRYGFPQLDRLNGYASGMPAPAWYQRVWEGLQGEADPWEMVARLLVDLGVLSRAAPPGVTAADEMDALGMIRRLAGFRGHPRPSREDVLDGIRSAFVKGSMDAEGSLWTSRVRLLLAGDRIGSLPPGAPVAPLVQDFQRAAREHRIDVATPLDCRRELRLYDSAPHRAVSRFFYRLVHLGVPFARLQAGPDFVLGRDLNRVIEEWVHRWSPATDVTLTEMSLYGGTLEEAAAAFIQEQADAIEGREGSAVRMATLLLSACRMGLHRAAPDLLIRTASWVAGDSSFTSLVTAARQLALLHQSREPLEAHGLEGVLDAADEACTRACYLLPNLASTGEEAEAQVLDALNGLLAVALALGGGERRHELRRTGLLSIVGSDGSNRVVRGGAAGVLFADGDLPEEDLVATAVGLLELEGPAFLRGLLHTDRASLWQVPALLGGLHRVLAGMERDRFVRLLPELRMAFASLTARETRRVAEEIVRSGGSSRLPLVMLGDVSPEEVILGHDIESRMRRALERDGLGVLVGGGERVG